MKLKLLFILLFSSTVLKAQVYHPMLGDSTKWSVYKEIPDGGWTIYLEVKSDTIINGLKYQKMFSSENYPHNIPIAQNGLGYFLLREDTLNEKVYLRYFDTIIKEKVVYDFSMLTTGDSILLPFIRTQKVELIKYYIDSVKQYNSLIGVVNVQVLRKDTADWFYPNFITWVEGLGSINPNSSFYQSIYYPFYFLEPFFSYEYMPICNFRNGVHQYQNRNLMVSPQDSCFVPSWMGINNVEKNQIVSISPNPTTTSFIIQKATPEKLNFQLYNLIGQNVANENLKENQTAVERNGLPSGAYLYSIRNQQGVMVQSGKVVFE